VPPDLLVLADDLTGALEVGAKLRAVVGFDLPAQVIDTETRHVPPPEAAARVRSLLAKAVRPRIFKKTDSTLQGNIGAELAALSEAYPGETIHYIPAYPDMGRIVRQGHLYVHGVRVPNGSVRAVVGDLPNIVIHDAETDDEVAAALCQAGRIVCGPACIADYLAPAAPAVLPAIRSCVVVNGSLQETSARQIDHAVERGWRVVEAAGLAGAMKESCWVILRVEHARINAAAICDILTEAAPDALAVFGGDTVYAIVQALGEQVIAPVAELLPGVPISRLKNMYLITKAGGFGPKQVLTEIRCSLESR